MNVQYWEGGAIASCTLLFSQESGVMNTGSGLWPGQDGRRTNWTNHAAYCGLVAVHG